MPFKIKRIRDNKHLAYIRTLNCIIKDKGKYCNGKPIHAHHLTHVDDNGGMGLKTGDNYTIPICSFHHFTLHNLGEKRFWKSWGINAEKEANKLWEKSHEVS